ncbi:MAG: tetratricopeptide repeat protein [Thermoplasmatota archaeon]
MIDKERFIEEIDKMSRERFQKLCINLLEEMGFEITSARSFGGDFEAEAEIEIGVKVEDYIVRVTRSGGDPQKEIEGLRNVMGAGVRGLYITTSDIDSDFEAPENVEISGSEEFYELMKEYDLLEGFDEVQKEGHGLPSAAEIGRLIDWGDEFLGKNNYPKAIEYYDEAIDKKPESIKPRIKKAQALLEFGDPERGKETIETVLEKEAENATAWTLLGRAYHDLGKVDEEIEAYDRALDINEDHVDAWKAKGATLYEEGLYDEAELCFDRVLEVEPKDEGAWNNKGLSLMKRGEYQDALNAINNALSISQDFIDALINKTLVLENQNKIAKALQIVERLIALRPDRPDFHYIKAAYLEATGDIEDAHKSVSKALRLKPDHERARKLKIRLDKRMENIGGAGEYQENGPQETGPASNQEELGSDNRMIAEKIDKLEREVNDLKETKENLEKEVAMIKGEGTVTEEATEWEKLSTGEREAAEKEREEIKGIVEEKESLLEELEKRQEELEQAIRDKQRLEDKVSELRSRSDIEGKQIVEELKDEKEELRERLEKSLNKVQELALEKERLERDISEMEERKEKEIKEDMKGEIEKKEKIIEKLIEERDELKAELQQRKSEMGEIKEKKEKLEKRIIEKEAQEEQKRKAIEKRVKEEDVQADASGISKISKGTLLYKMGENDKAIETLSGELSDRGKNLLGCCYYERGELKKSEKAFVESESFLGDFNLEKVFYERNQFRHCIGISEDIMDESKDFNVYWESRGECMRRLKKYDDAVLSYIKAEEIAGKDIEDFIMAESRCGALIDSPKEEINRLERLVEKMHSPKIMNLLSGFYFSEEHYSRSLELLRDISEKEDPLIYNNLGCVAFHMERFGEALSAFEKAISLNSENPIYLNNLGFCQLERNLLEAALENFDKATEITEEDPVSWYNKGIAMKRLELDGWKDSFERAVELDSDFEEAKKMLKT